MQTIEIIRVGHSLEALQHEESVSYEINMTEHLNGDTIQSHTFEIYDSDDESVTADFAKGSSVSGDVLSFGVFGHAVGVYMIQCWVTCNQYLPDLVTRRRYLIELNLTVK